jgi:hypothetical protein
MSDYGGDFGVLAIWNDCRAGREAEFETWFQGEHLLERLAVPGFLFGRRHKAISGSSGFFNFYLTETPAVLTSKPYLERLDNPTPMTRSVMSDIFINMNRTVCRRVLRRGAFRGAYVVTVRYSAAPDEAALAAEIDALMADPAKVANAEIWIALDPAGMPVSMEEQLRGGDKKIAGCLMIDTLRQVDAEAIGASLARKFSGTDVGVFRVLCQLGRGDL